MPEVPEYIVNAKLAEILREDFGIDARAERVKGRKRPDIRCFYNGLIIGIEASYDRWDAERDAEERLKQGPAEIVLALWIKERFKDVPEDVLKDEIRRSKKFAVKVFFPRDLSRTPVLFTEWFEDVDLPTLKTIIDKSIEHIIGEEEVRRLIEEVKSKVSDFTKSLSELDRSGEIRRKIYNILYRLYGLSVARAQDPEVAFGHAALSILLSAVFYEHVRGIHAQLKSLRWYVYGEGSEKGFGPIEGLKRALEDLLKIDYKVAVGATREMLDVLPSAIAYRVRDLIDLAIKIAQNRALLNRDFAGRVYHEITGDIALRKGFATFYTEVPSAYLLATLASEVLLDLDKVSLLELDKEGARRIVEKIRSVRVGDLACGSGTLLTATYYSLHRLATALKYYYDLEDVDLDKLGRELIENNIYGVDALRYASQITAINLALVGPEGVSRENVYAIYLGYIPQRNQAWLGSLELLVGNAKRIGGILSYIEGSPGGSVERVSLEGTEGTFQMPNKLSMIIMNPPFTRATGRTEGFEGERGLFGFVADEAARQKLLEAYERVRESVRKDLVAIASSFASSLPDAIRDIVRGEEGLRQHLSIGQAGEGLLFLYLAYKYIEDDGVIAFVLPRGLLAGVSWFLARTLLASKFHVKYVVVSSDAERGYNFSEGVALSEALIVAKRSDVHSKDEETIFVNLLKKPRTAIEAIMLGEAVKKAAKHLEDGKSAVVEATGSAALVLKVKREELLRYLDNWNRFVAVTDPKLLNIVADLYERGEIVINSQRIRIPIAQFNSVIDKLGIDRRQFHDLFTKTSISTPYPILYGGGEEVRSTMKVEPNAFATPKTERAEAVFREYSGKILVPDRVWWETAHVVALYSETPVLSNIFYAVKLGVPSEVMEYAEKALVLWLNTTWGLLAVLTSRQETRGAWTSLKMGQWRLLPVLDIKALSADTLKRLASVFDEYGGKPLRRIPEQFKPGNPDPVRLSIDVEFVKALKPDIDEGEVKKHLLELYKHIDVALKQWIG